MTMTKVTPAVKPRRQDKQTNCWLTCFQMMFEWKRDAGDSSKNPADIESIIDTKSSLWADQLVNYGIATHECREVGRALGMVCTGDGVIHGEFLRDVLKTYGPVWIAGRWYGNYDHVILITGCNSQTDKVTYINPWQNFTLEESSAPLRWLNDRKDLWKNCDASIMYWRR